MTGSGPILVNGGLHTDERGTLSFFNDFNMAPVKRFYVIDHPNTNIVRAWQGHKVEQKWFYVITGSFRINIVKPDNWESPSENIVVKEFILESATNQVLYVPGGYANGLKALKPHSKLIVFSDVSSADAGKDNFRFDKSLWYDWEK